MSLSAREYNLRKESLNYWRGKYREAYTMYRRYRSIVHQLAAANQPYGFYDGEVSHWLSILRAVKPVFQEAIDRFYMRTPIEECQTFKVSDIMSRKAAEDYARKHPWRAFHPVHNWRVEKTRVLGSNLPCVPAYIKQFVFC